MLAWSVMFLIISAVAGVFGVESIAATGAGIARLLFPVFVVAALIAIAVNWARTRHTGGAP